MAEDPPTVLVGGFPRDASERELLNFCRFLPGFSGAQANLAAGPSVWVFFDTPESALGAVLFVEGQPFGLVDSSYPLTASMAKQDATPDQATADQNGGDGAGVLPGMLQTQVAAGPDQAAGGWQLATAGPQGGGAWGQAPGPEVWPAVGGDQAAKRARLDVPDNQNDTLCVFAIGEKGMTESTLATFFEQMDGFVTVSVSNKGRGGGNGFVKFVSPAAAAAALKMSIDLGLEAEFARTSLNVGWAAATAATAATAAPAPQPSGGFQVTLPGAGGAAGWVAGYSMDVSNGAGNSWHPEVPDSQQDTLMITGINEQVLQQVLIQLEGFVAHRTAMGKNGDPLCFAKFATPAHAKAAIQMAISAGISSSNVRFAKTSMNLGSGPAAAPYAQVPYVSSTPKPEKEIPPPGEQTLAIAQFGGCATGIMKANNTNFGFIKQDNGEEDIFVMPRSCDGFGMVLPPVGTRVAFTVGMDETRPGRVRAQNVTPA